MFICHSCNKGIETEVDKTCGGVGYGIDANGNKNCYDCCGQADRKQMEDSNRITLYLTCESARKMRDANNRPYTNATLNSGKGRSTKGTVSNWPGTLKIPCHTRAGRHNIAGTRYDCWFTDHAGNKWHGVQYGENTQIVHCRKLKA